MRNKKLPTPTVAAVIAQVSGVLSISIMPVCVLLFLMDCFQVWWDKQKYRAMKEKVSRED
ncbi:hypothetical protein OTL63_004337 [Salmonella enterica]|nr:hypothetical protein [Salmonella enterica]EKE1575712.1 hypothetical protein [Salmonella enterica]